MIYMPAVSLWMLGIGLILCSSSGEADLQDEQGSSIGRVDTDPGLERRFHGDGGLYILPQKVQCNGIAVSIDFCAFLNTNQTSNHTFEFRLGLYREQPGVDIQREQLWFISVENTQQVPGQLGTVYCETDRKIPRWSVQEGDQFAVLISNDCGDVYCPTLLTLVTNSNTSQGSLFWPAYNSISLTIDTTDQRLMKVPVEANIRISIIPTPPTLPEYCTIQPTPSCLLSPSQGTTVGSVDTNPGPERRFPWGGLYILPQTVQRDGMAVSIDFCAFLDRKGTNNNRFHFILGLYREINGELIRQQQLRIDIENEQSARGQQDTVHCENDRSILLVNVQEGDQFAVLILNDCEKFCPAQLNLISNESCQGSLFQHSNGVSYSIDLNRAQSLTAVQVELNIKISIIPTPPALPDHCTELLTPSCLMTQDISIGRVDTNPGLERRFPWGGLYILPQSVQRDGLAVSIDFCAFLDAKGTNFNTFRFILGLYREINGSLIRQRQWRIGLENEQPEMGQQDTLHCENDRSILLVNVQEGDQFAVLILNNCGPVLCPAQLNLIAKESCQGSLFQHSQTDDFISYRIDITGQQLTSVQVEANIKINIIPSEPNYIQATPHLPLCDVTLTSMIDSTRPSEGIMPIPTIDSTRLTSYSERVTPIPTVDSTRLTSSSERVTPMPTQVIENIPSDNNSIQETGIYTIIILSFIVTMVIFVILLVLLIRRHMYRQDTRSLQTTLSPPTSILTPGTVSNTDTEMAMVPNDAYNTEMTMMPNSSYEGQFSVSENTDLENVYEQIRDP